MRTPSCFGKRISAADREFARPGSSEDNWRLCYGSHVILKRFGRPAAQKALISSAQVDEILGIVQPYSMVHESGVRFTIDSAVSVIARNLPGVFIECGTWRGGCSVAMLLAQRVAFGEVRRPVYMLDSFAGLPKVEPRDGPLAAAWQAGADPAKFFDNCKAAADDLDGLLAAQRFVPGDYYLVRGWFNDTVPKLAKELSNTGIALLRLDGDWYGSTEVCLQHLCPVVAEEGVVIIDDYYAWDGCARAVHDYLSTHDLSYRIKSLYNNYGAYFIKRGARKSFEEF